MHCQIKTIAAVKASGGEALLQVKSNQPSLEAAFDALPLQHEPADCHVETGKIRRNRQEKRVVEVFRAGRLLELPEWRTDVVEAVRVTRTVQRQDVAIGWKWRCTYDVAWYASTRPGTSAEQYAAATRGHWGWRTGSTTYWTLPCTRTPAGSARARPSCPSCAASPSTSCGSTRSTTLPTPYGATP